MEKGIKGTQTVVVTQELTAQVMKSGTLSVYATPAMVALMEETAYKSVEPYLEAGEGTVGSAMSMKHLAPSVLGATILCESELTEVDGRKLTFHLIVKDKDVIVGEGEHVRFIIQEEKFLEKAKLRG